MLIEFSENELSTILINLLQCDSEYGYDKNVDIIINKINDLIKYRV